MSCYRRIRVPGATIFFTVALEQRGSTVLTDEIARLRLAFAQTQAERPFTLDACVVLPDHLHCVWTLPPGDADYSTRWRLIKARFSLGLSPGNRRASRLASDERGLWQRRFREHHIRDDAEYQAHLRYCRNDPVKHGFCASPHDWPFSSIHRDAARGLVA